MTDLEKLKNHQWYNTHADDIRLCCEDVKAKLLQYNNIPTSQHEEREKILRQVFGSVGKNPWIESPFQCDIGETTHIGDNFYANHGCVFLDAGGLHIGNNVLIGPLVGIYTPEHAFDPTLRAQGYEISRPIVIEDNVWIGGGTSIVAPVTIGRNSIIGAGSVVTRDIPPNVVAAGNPCRVLHPLTEEDKKLHGPKLD